MDDTLGFEESVTKRSSEEWQIGSQSDSSLAAVSNLEPCQLDLYVLPNKEDLLRRPRIPASFMEKLSFYRSFTSTSSKIELLCMQQNNVNRFFWFYVSNVLCKSLPMTYVYEFLSTYAPEHHYFLPKMVPICYGCNWIFIVTAVFGLIILVNNTSLYFIYTITGLFYKAPWNRCPVELFEVDGSRFTCYNLTEFSKKFESGNISYAEYFYVLPQKENFSVAQIEYFDFLLTEGHYRKWHSAAVFIMWVVAICLHNQMFKKYIWKVLHYTHIVLTAILLIIFIHLVITIEDTEIQNIETSDDKLRKYLMNADFDLLAESMTTPSVVHIISSRSIDEIYPSQDSAVIIISNAIYNMFRALTSFLMKKYCENWVKGSIIYWNYGSGSLFYFWPMYFATLFWGDIFVIVFFALNGIVDYCVFVITFQCLIESITREWTWIRPWLIMLIICILANLEVNLLDGTYSENCFVFWTGISTLAEPVILFWMYSLSRFIDDITFHYGVYPTRLRIWSFMIVPVFYSVKIYIMLSRFLTALNENMLFKELHDTRASFIYQSVLFCVGAVYAFYYYVKKQNKNWTQLFKPVPEWGPKDFDARQLRKQFDSREYIGSQAPRLLSRHMISKAELKSYKVDIPYHNLLRRSMFFDKV